ncbi:hypothetical protein [Streptomyces sp. ISL-94]|uniref:hypothetical protein n=1 Tax=Streptomyces sp. ISL-94 TaxID=2819190 RepID=UPI001BE74F19|nr:hypothetical protein [Streptomyces sp. ISL-94]MBT2476706.1 hypothetical protein [Streptomyces sp. ISL-94]
MKKIKRIAAMAAVAVAGPTALLSTPAMAADQPAVIVPDTAPKEDAAPVTGEAGKTPETTAPVVEAPAPKPVGQQPAPAAPKTGQPAKDAKAAEDKQDEQDAESDGILMGPEVTLAGIPKDGFKADGSWTTLKVKVDNSGHTAVPNYTPNLTVFQEDDKFKASQVKVEWRVGNQSWQAAQPIQTPELGPGLQYALGTTPNLAKGAVQTVDVRISFAADSPVVAFELSTDGQSRTANGTNHSPASWYTAKISGATGGDEEPAVVDGPELTVNGVPETIAVGGGWTTLSVHVDNSGKEALKDFYLGLVLARPDWVSMQADQIKVEVLSKDLDGKAGWHETELRSDEGPYIGLDLAGGPVKAGQSFDVQVRVRFTADAPTGDLTFRSFGMAPLGEDYEDGIAMSRSTPQLTQLVAATPETSDEGETGNQPKPNGDAKPIVDTTGGNTTAGNTGGELAATGADAATSWALGGAGVALAMGATLVAGTGRRRRTTA